MRECLSVCQRERVRKGEKELMRGREEERKKDNVILMIARAFTLLLPLYHTFTPTHPRIHTSTHPHIHIHNCTRERN